MGMSEDVFWNLTPKTIQIRFEAYQEKRKMELQDIWLGGKYVAHAICSTLCFDKSKKPPPYPEMPFKEDFEEDLSHNEEWLKKERLRAFQTFSALLGKGKSIKEER